MAADSSPTPKQSSDETPPRGAQAAESGFALVAKRISSWTTNLVLSGLIVVLGLGLGRQVLQWWAEDSPNASLLTQHDRAVDGLGDPMLPHQIEFGDAAWSLLRQSVDGDREAAMEAMRLACRAVTPSATLPDVPAEASERRLIESLDATMPLDREPDRWRLHRLNEVFPMMVGTRIPPEGTPSVEGGDIAKTPYRVVTWGLAIPGDAAAWTVFTFSRSAGQVEPSTGLPDVPLPADSQKGLSIRTVGGGAIVSFHGTADLTVWRKSFAQWFDRNGWTAVGLERRTSSSWYLRYTDSAEKSATLVDIQCRLEDDGRATGMMVITPGSSPTKGNLK